jgi:glycosyltransferase involved in cell wall biosynthesis
VEELEMKSLSVLLPFHRHDHLLLEAVNSVMQSEGVDLQVILIDDTPQRERKSSFVFTHDSRIVLADTSGTKGYGYALEIGSKLIAHDHVALMNSDDLIHPHKFIKQIRELDESDICITDMKKISESGRLLPSLAGQVPGTLYDPSFLLLGSYGANASWMFSKKWWDKSAFFDSYSALDWRIALQSFGKSKISYITEPLYTYRVHSNQITKSPKAFKDADIVFEAWRKFERNFVGSNFSRNIFEIFAVPFANYEVADFDELVRWTDEILINLKYLSPAQRSLFESLLERRFLLLLRNPRNRNIKSLIKGLSSFRDFPKLVMDFSETRFNR